MTVWELLREYAATQSGPFTSQEALSWFRRHAHNKANERTIRTHIRGASWNVDNRSQFAAKEPFLTKLDRGLFRRARPEEIDGWRAGAPAPAIAPMPAAPAEGDPASEWHTEANTQRLLVEWLAGEGWTIVRTANTATREHGIDVVAERDGQRLGIEVKGYPSRFYVTGPKKGQLKTSTPKEQAKKWYAHALVPAMRLRTREPDARSVMCFPDFHVYRELYADTALSLRAAAIDVWVVSQDGEVVRLG
jgi:Holliday junction resolvase-like predicted endonuclease